ncbi:hypothetical protein cand_009050 [Cryptosporidium andersoni]|uniref:Uncharacterized protein n=1 Tax=Cryptosporidium andersoni TaxID=117008 RepID=A0A1J4MTC3_9CRYT|nr:hypothetical protein cand_009050 [Cryptosporidium andersoni]
MKRNRENSDNTLDESNILKKRDNNIDIDSRKQHTFWILSQAQKNLTFITRSFCYLCNRKLNTSTSRNNGNSIKKIKLLCTYCNRSTCDNEGCLLNECGICNVAICALCSTCTHRDLIICPNC